jgi:hypothetical protein
VSVGKRGESEEEENQTIKKRTLAELNAYDYKEGEIFDEQVNEVNDELFSSLHPDHKKQRLTSATDPRVSSQALRALEPQTAGWQGINLEDEMSWINEREASARLGDTSF